LKALLFAFVVFISVVAIGSYASSSSVLIVNKQAYSGEVRYIYFEKASAATSATPSTNTATTPSGSSGSYTISRGSSVYLWSPAFASSGTIGSGTWTLVLYALCSRSTTLTITFETTTSAGTVRSTVVNGIATKTIATTKAEVVSTFSGSSGMIPAGGYVGAVLTLSAGASSCTVYWGSGQQTDFQMPYRTLTS
jgi:hypothetical protein